MSKFKEVLAKVVPIQRDEWVKFLSIAGLIILITYIHTVLKIAKDTAVISGLGTESISAIKLYAGLPMSLVFMFVYIKLSDVFARARLFHCMNWFFITYFVLFATIFYPYREALSINISESVIAALPSFKYLFKLVANWHCCLFYCFSESWVTIMLSISFWQTANHVTSLDQSKRFYPLFGVLAQIGMLLAGCVTALFVAEGTNWQPALNNITISIVMAGIGVSACLFALEKITGVEIFNSKQNLSGVVKKSKPKMSFKDSLKYISSSKPILLITTLLLCYNVSINLVEGIWKKSIEVLFSGNPNQMQHFIGSVTIWVAVFSTVCAFAGIYIVKSCKWKTSALITPVAIIITGGAFFLFMLLKDTTYLLAYAGSVLTIGVYFGAANQLFARGTKHTLFDATKEMVYIPLDDELKTKGKAAAETIGMRAGKSSGALIQQVLLAMFPAATLMDLSPIISGIFLVLLVSWILATINLSKLFDKA